MNEQDKGASAAQWRGVPGFETIYMVSDQGDIRNRTTGLLLFGERDRNGYRKVNLSKRGKAIKRRVHRIVCEAFHGPCPDGLECAHLDGNPRNNRADNLAWVTRSENNRHKAAHGTHAGSANLKCGQPGAKNGNARFSDQEAAAIRGRHQQGWSDRKIAAEFGCAYSTINKIVSGRSYNG